MKKIAFVALSATLLQGCAAIIDGSHQDIIVNTTPAQADCAFVRKNGEDAGRVGATPGTATIKKTNDDLTITCRKPGYQDASYLNKSSIDPWYWADWIIPGGIIGLGVDWGTGAWNEYKSDQVSLVLPALNNAGATAPIPLPAETTATEKTIAAPGLKPDAAAIAPGAPPEADALSIPAAPAGLPAPSSAMLPAPAGIFVTPDNNVSATGVTPKMVAPSRVEPVAPASSPASPFGAPSTPLKPHAPLKSAPSSSNAAPADASNIVATSPNTGSSINSGWGALGSEPNGGWSH